MNIGKKLFPMNSTHITYIQWDGFHNGLKKDTERERIR